LRDRRALCAQKAKAFLWPSEFAALVSSEAVPLAWRRMFAITTYLYARAGEVNALRWEDVDLERGVVHLHASVNRNTGTRKVTKTDDARRVPIERELLPLLRAMHEETGGRGVVAPVRATDRKLSPAPPLGVNQDSCPKIVTAPVARLGLLAPPA
jgi:integrase